MGFPRQEYWSGLPFPSPGDLPNPEIKPECPVLADGLFNTDYYCPPDQDPVFPRASPSHRKLAQASYPHPSEGRQTENHNQRKVTKLITRTTTLSNSTKLCAMPCRTTQDKPVLVESSDQTQSTKEQNSEPLQYSSLENLMNSMKWHKDMALKDEPPRLVGVH